MEALTVRFRRDTTASPNGRDPVDYSEGEVASLPRRLVEILTREGRPDGPACEVIEAEGDADTAAEATPEEPGGDDGDAEASTGSDEAGEKSVAAPEENTEATPEEPGEWPTWDLSMTPQAYLERYPNGPKAELANAVIEAERGD